jgi:hypothetical protein
MGVLGFDSQLELGIFLFTTVSRMALEPTQPPIQWVPGVLSLGVKQPGREADHSPPPSAGGQRMSGAIPPLPNTPPWRGTQLEHRDNFTFYIVLKQTMYSLYCIVNHPPPNPTPNTKLEVNSLLAVRDCISDIVATVLHSWRPYPSSATWGRAMAWWQGTNLISTK